MARVLTTSETKRFYDWFKLVRYGEDGEFELYDLLDDPLVTKSIVADWPEIAVRLKASLMKWRTDCKRSNAGADYGSGF